MDLQRIQIEDCKKSNIQISDHSTSCDSPEVAGKINRKLYSIDLPAKPRRFSLPLSKIIHIERDSPSKFDQVIAGNKLNLDNNLKIKPDFKPILKRSVYIQHSFLLEDFDSSRFKRFHSITATSKPEHWQEKLRNHKPARFAPLSDMKPNFPIPKLSRNKKVFQVNLNFLLQEKYTKIKADLQFKDLITNRPPPRHQTAKTAKIAKTAKTALEAQPG